MEYEKAYVFQPDDARPTKRRRVEPQGMQATWGLRKKAYQTTWRTQRERYNVRQTLVFSNVLKLTFADEDT